MNWLKKKFEQLASKLNADEDAPLQKPQSKATVSEVGPTFIPAKEPPPKAIPRVDNIEALKEITLGAIHQTVRMLGYGNAIISGLVFHSRFKDNAIENVGLMSLTKDRNFINRIKRDFKSRGISFKEELSMEVIHESPDVDKVSQISDGIGVEVLTPHDGLKRLRARIVATEGVTWEPEYFLEPTGKYYFIGRCKHPKMEHGPKIHNDIAFIGPEEDAHPDYAINSHISRSHAAIVFDKEIGVYKIYRSKFLNNPAHKIKIFNPSLDDFDGISLNQTTVPHVLKDGDTITFNDTIVMVFNLLK